jgi:hypothetical protein
MSQAQPITRECTYQVGQRVLYQPKYPMYKESRDQRPGIIIANANSRQNGSYSIYQIQLDNGLRLNAISNEITPEPTV